MTGRACVFSKALLARDSISAGLTVGTTLLADFCCFVEEKLGGTSGAGVVRSETYIDAGTL